MRRFNTEGPVRLDDHYAIPPLARANVDELLGLIHAERYCVLHAPRQTGKTSALLALRDLLNETGEVLCVYANFEVGQAMRENLELAMRAMLDELASRALAAGDGFLEDAWLGVLAKSGPGGVLRDGDRRGLEGTIERGLEQTLGYMDKCGSDEGHLVVFDRTGEVQGFEPGDGGKRWEDQLFRREETRNGRKVAVWGM